MRASPASVSASNHYSWRVEDKPVAVQLSLEVVRRMQPLLAVTPGSRAVESGGILLGHVQQASHSWIVSVEDFALIEIEHARGASWTLSSRDRQQFGRQLRRLSRRVPVGWFRTHTRPGLFLDQHDFNLFREFFSHEASVALAIRPEPEHGAEAGFFFWEEGDVRRATTYRSFPFRPEALAPVREAPSPVVAMPAAPAASPAVRTRPGVIRTMPAARPAAPPVSLRRKALYMAPIAAGLAAGILWQPRALRQPAATHAVSPPIAPAESARTVFAPPPEPEAAPVPEAEVAESAPMPAPVRATPVQSRSRTVTPHKKLQIETARARPAAPEPRLDFRAPEVAFAPRLEQNPFTPAPVTPRVAATVEAVQVSGVRRAVGSIPGLGFLKRKKHDEAFVPPRPLHQIQPAGLALMAEDEPVRVKVTVAPSGEVASAELVSRRIQPSVARAAMDAARKWRFAPATLDDKPVSSQLILSFSVAGSASRGI